MLATPLQFGPLRLATNLFLSPLAGYTNLPFRLIIRELGGVGLCTTDLVNARSLLEKNAKARKLIESRVEDAPLAVQLFGSVPEEMRAAAELLEACGVAAIDVNMGCPVRKVCQIGGGSAMMSDWRGTTQLVRGMVEAVRLPVTCKMRLGWDAENQTAPDLARALEQIGVAAITVHGRTRQQGFDGAVDLGGIARVVAAVDQIPVIGNGDVTTPEAARQMCLVTGCAGVGIGRGAFYNPWIFAQTWHYFSTGELRPEASFSARIEIMTRHLERMIEVFGEPLGCTMFRKVGPWYARRFGPASFFNKGIVRVSSWDGFHDLLARYIVWRKPFLDDRGELLQRFQPGALEPNFVDSAEPASEPASTRRNTILVPAGPNELW